MKKQLTIIGSTGSIGTQALDIVRNRPNDFEIVALSAGKNLKLFIDQVKEFKPKFITILKDEDKQELKKLFPELEILKDIKELASLDGIDIVLSAIVGIAGLEANLLALKHAKRLAVANKETLVSAGHLVRDYTKNYNSELIPIDSEHVAIHQCLGGHQNSVKEILLTSSGGPFRTWDKEKFPEITLEDALKHPTWTMGPKITIDSSTLMNKALEVIEVQALFGEDYKIDYDQIKVVIHPQSIVHSAVTFVDGNTLAQLGSPDMRVPIQYALDYPSRKPLPVQDDFDIFKASKLEFYEPDRDKFPALDLAYKAGKLGDSYPTVLNSANEHAVKLFLDGKIQYIDIARIVEKSLEEHQVIKNPQVEDILALHSKLASSIEEAFCV